MALADHQIVGLVTVSNNIYNYHVCFGLMFYLNAAFSSCHWVPGAVTIAQMSDSVLVLHREHA